MTDQKISYAEIAYSNMMSIEAIVSRLRLLYETLYQ